MSPGDLGEAASSFLAMQPDHRVAVPQGVSLVRVFAGMNVGVSCVFIRWCMCGVSGVLPDEDFGVFRKSVSLPFFLSYSLREERRLFCAHGLAIILSLWFSLVHMLRVWRISPSVKPEFSQIFRSFQGLFWLRIGCLK